MVRFIERSDAKRKSARYTGHVMTEKRTRGPGRGTRRNILSRGIICQDAGMVQW